MLLKNFHGQCRALQPVIYKIALIIFSYWPFSFYSNFTQTDFRNIKLHFSKFANTKEISNKLHSIPLNLFLQVFFFIETLKQSVNCKNLLFLVLQNCCMLIEKSIFKLIKKNSKGDRKRTVETREGRPENKDEGREERQRFQWF